MTSLSPQDLAALRDIIGDVVEERIREKVPAIMREELETIGIVASTATERVSQQRDMAFLHKIRRGAEDNASLIFRRVIVGVLSVVALLVVAGFWALVRAKSTG